MSTVTFAAGDKVISKLGTRAIVIRHFIGRYGYELVEVQLQDGRVCNYPPFLLKKEANQ